mmetsp:Transcript_12270/g.17451  ORF Transcript_12270/g.17451 Transcript_12270/m.17451 type:complete len:171 (-) Transcript_12270:177-689(-)
MASPSYKLQCDCGQVKATLKSSSEDQNLIQVAGFCHCKPCRDCTGAPMIEFWAVKEDSITFDEDGSGEEALGKYKMKDYEMIRHFCKSCGQHMYNSNKFPGLMIVGVNALKNHNDSVGKDEATKSGIHLHYSERVHDCHDSLPKFLNFPEPFGGDGKLFGEDEENKTAEE